MRIVSGSDFGGWPRKYEVRFTVDTKGFGLEDLFLERPFVEVRDFGVLFFGAKLIDASEILASVES